jgi:hypothetical protein
MAMYFNTPFAIGGDRVPVPELTTDGSVNMTNGWPLTYSENLLTNPSARPPARVTFNELYYEVTLALQQYQQFSAPEFITTADNLGTPFPYATGAVVYYNDGFGFRYYKSLIDSNVTLPTDTTKWQVLPFYTLGTATGTANVITYNAAVPYDSFVSGDTVILQAAFSNTGAATLQVGTGSAVPINAAGPMGFGALTPGMILAGSYCIFTYNAGTSSWQLMNPTLQSIVPQKSVTPLGDLALNPWQRQSTFTAVADNKYTADLWRYNKTGTVVRNVSQTNDAPDAPTFGNYSNQSLLATVTTSQGSPGSTTDQEVFTYFIEGFDFVRLAQQPMIVCLRAKFAVAGIHCVAFQNADRSQSYVAEITATAANTWQQFLISIPASPSAGGWNYTNGIGLSISIQLLANSTSTYLTATPNMWLAGDFRITANQVNEAGTIGNNFVLNLLKIEPGSVFTGVSVFSEQEILAFAQRYYEKSYDQGVYAGAFPALSCPGYLGLLNLSPGGAATGDTTVTYATSKRTTPVVTPYGPANGTINSMNNTGLLGATDYPCVATAFMHGVSITNSGSGVPGGRYVVHFISDASFY